MNLLSVQNVSKEFPVEGGVFRRRIGTVAALRTVSFELREGETLGLVGESGSGKTTLGRIIARLLEPTTGAILWEGRPAASFSRREWAARIQMIFQDPTASLNPKLSVRTLLGEAVSIRFRIDGRRPAGSEIDNEAADLLKTVGLPEDALFYYPHQFSGGQKQRLAIARALAMKPRVLVADEPVSALDLSIQAQVLNLLTDMKERFRLTTIIVSHDLAVVGHLADRLLVMKDGKILEQGECRTVLSAPSNSYTKTLLEAVPRFLR
jgi:ABC-type glutathione transport system ATPase component